MGYAVVAVSPYPNVPAVPGVPSLRRLATGLGLGPIIAVADAAGLGSLFGAPLWGIFAANGAPVLTGDCVAEMEYRHDYRISTFPVERGGFGNYDKVQLPQIARVIFMVGGTDAARAAFLDTAEQMAESLALFSVATPEITYTSVNVTGISYRRSAQQGAALMRVEISVEEVRVAPDSQFTNTAQPNGAAVQNQGAAPTGIVVENLPAPTLPAPT